MRIYKHCNRDGKRQGQVRLYLAVSLRMVLALFLLAGLLVGGVILFFIGRAAESADRLTRLEKAYVRLRVRAEEQHVALKKFQSALPEDQAALPFQEAAAYVELLGEQARAHMAILRLFRQRDYETCLQRSETLLADPTVEESLRHNIRDKRAWCLLYLGRSDEARAAAQALTRDYPADLASLQTAADIHLETGQYEAAETMLNRLVKEAPNPLNHFSMAKLRRIQKRYDEADAYFRFVIARGDMLLAELAVADLALMKIEDELALARGNYFTNMLVQLAPRTALSAVTVGRILLLQKRATEAKSVLEDTLQRHPDHPVLLMQMAAAQRMAGGDGEAYLARARTVEPQIDARLARLEEAIATFQKRMREQRPPAGTPGEGSP